MRINFNFLANMGSLNTILYKCKWLINWTINYNHSRMNGEFPRKVLKTPNSYLNSQNLIPSHFDLNLPVKGM
ncbi:MAG: hypothetical protein Ta2E_01670 [Mycoplasmoidaceae bacterium]|nr:MAG: hypothetical protein Ta2E_01670 [Mycoplasmoidaceae bacterium]